MIFYNVPDAPGVPAMLRDPLAAVPPVYTPAASLILDFVSPTAPGVSATTDEALGTWGVFYADGQLAVEPDTFLGIEYRNSTRISNYPLEEGAFESYNKVADPFDVVVGLACGGSMERRTEFLAVVRALAGSLDLFTVVTPEEVFESVNIERYDYKRSERNGVGLVTVNLYFKEIRINGETEFTNTPENAPTVAEAQEATTAQTADTARAATPLEASQVQNPASASEVSQGQTQAQPATPDQAAPAPGSNVPNTAFDAPKTAPALTKLPPGYTQSPETGLIRDPSGKVDREMTINQGTSYIGPGG